MTSQKSGVKDLLQFQAALTKAILKHRPINFEALEILGHALTRLGLHAEALKVDKQITSLYPDSPVAHYNLACSYSNLGKVDEAFESLFHAANYGYDDIAHMKKDPDLKNLRHDPRFAQLLFIIRRRKHSTRLN